MSYEPELCAAKPATDLERHLEAVWEALKGQAEVCEQNGRIMADDFVAASRWTELADFLLCAEDYIRSSRIQLRRLLDRIDAEAASKSEPGPSAEPPPIAAPHSPSTSGEWPHSASGVGASGGARHQAPQPPSEDGWR